MKTRLFKNIGETPERLRIPGPMGLGRGKVNPSGGQFGAGLIEGVSLVTRGEALGHGLWLDSEFIEQVNAAGGEAENGLKARFAHPGLSDDGIGSMLGRWRNFRKSGSKQVFADLHLAESAHVAPDGDLAGYLLKLAEESPEMFGASIVFELDDAAMGEFKAGNLDREGRFISPDRENRANLPHARLRKLHGADMVDEPAANPAGLFSADKGNELPAEAEAVLLYALGLSETAPEGRLLGVAPERARAFVRGFMGRHGVRVNAECGMRNAEPEEEPDPRLLARIEVLERKVRDLTARIAIGR